MTIDHAINECDRLATAYVTASGGSDKGKADAAFHRLLVAIEGLKLEGHKHLANKILVGALHDAMHAASASLRDALNAQRNVA